MCNEDISQKSCLDAKEIESNMLEDFYECEKDLKDCI